MHFPIDENRRQTRHQDELPTYEECRLVLAVLEEAVEAGDYEVFWGSYRTIEPTGMLVAECCATHEMSVPTVAFLFGLDAAMIVDILMLEWLVSGMKEGQATRALSIARFLSKDRLARKRSHSNPTLKMILESAA